MMKKFLFVLAGTLLLGLTSCEKCADCSCSYTQVYEFEDGFDGTFEQAIRNQYDASSPQNYPPISEEICASRGDFDDEIDSFEAGSAEFSDEGTNNGLAWSFSLDYDCTCQED